MLIGHEKLKKDFKDLVKNGALGHGYIFFGSPRIGKKLFALSLANFLEGKEFDYRDGDLLHDGYLIEPAGGAVGIDKVREIKNFLWQKPNVSNYRMLIIDEAEKMTDEAQNALLKVAEEPAPSSLLILIIDDPDKLRPTIQSRFQKMYFPPVPKKEVANWLVSENSVSKEKAEDIAQDSLGMPGLAKALVYDEELKKYLDLAKQFLAGKGTAKRAFIKEMVADEDFKIAPFLEALQILFVREGVVSRGGNSAWHFVCELKRQATYFNINPRIQLNALVNRINGSGD